MENSDGNANRHRCTSKLQIAALGGLLLVQYVVLSRDDNVFEKQHKAPAGIRRVFPIKSHVA